jgi:tellurite resistance protein TerC
VGLALVLAFVGAKMLIADRYRISDLVSLLVVAGLISFAALLSLLVPPKNAAPQPSTKDPTGPDEPPG